MVRFVAILSVGSLLPGLIVAAEPGARPADLAALMAQPEPIPALLRDVVGQSAKDDLSSLAVHETDVIYGKKYGTALIMETFTPKQGRKDAGVIVVISGGFWSSPEAIRAFAWSGIRGLIEKGYVVFAVKR